MKVAFALISMSLAAMAVSAGPAGAAMGACEGAYVKRSPEDQIRLYSICLDGLQEEAIAGALHNRGVAYLVTGQLERAMSDFDESLLYDGEYGLAYFNRAAVYAAQGQLTRAMADLESALELRPSRVHVEAYFRRGMIRQAMGDFTGAVEDFDRVINRNMPWFDPERTFKRDQIAAGQAAKALLLATAPDPAFRDGATALTLAQSALEHDDTADARAALAAAYAETGQMEAAIREQMLALQLAADQGAVDDGRLSAQLASYQAGEPYREALAGCSERSATECARYDWGTERMVLYRTRLNADMNAGRAIE